MELYIRHVERVRCSDECAAFQRETRGRARPGQEGPRHREHPALGPHQAIGQRRGLRRMDGVDTQMVLQVAPHIAQVADRRDAQHLEIVGGTDARQHEQLRRVHRAAAHDHLARSMRGHRFPTAPVAHAGGAGSIEDDPFAQRTSFHREVGPVEDRFQIGRSRTPSTGVADGELVPPETFLLGAVEIWVGRVAGLNPRRHEGVEQVVVMGGIANRQRPVRPVIRIAAAHIALRPLEVGQDIGIGPPRQAELAPVVVIARMSADIDHAIDERRSAERLAPWP